MVCLMPDLYELGVFNTEMNTGQWRPYRLTVDNLKVAAYMPLRHNLPWGIVYCAAYSFIFT